MMRKKVLKVLFLSVTLSSCDLIKIWDEGDIQFTIFNKTESRITIESFVKGSSVGKFQIEPNSKIIKYTNDLGNNPSFMPVNTVDSLVVSKEKNGEHFDFYCSGIGLLGAGEKCPELLGELPNLFLSETCEAVDEIIDGKRVLSRCSAEINEEDFKRRRTL